MSSPMLAERSPLAHLTKPGMFGTAKPQPGVMLLPVNYSGLSSVIARGRLKPALIAAVREQFSVELPLSPRRTEAGEFAFIWVGRDQWLVTSVGAIEAMEQRLEKLVPLAAICDLSDSRAMVRVAGPQARSTLARGVGIDLHPRAFKPGDCAVTTIGHIGAIVWQVDEVPTYEIATFRSLAESFWHWLTQSAAQYGYQIKDGG